MKKITLKGLQRAYQLRFEPENYLRVANFFWVSVLVITICAMIVSIALGAMLFIAPPKQVNVEAAAGGILGFNRAQLKAIVEGFEKRTATFETMMSKE